MFMGIWGFCFPMRWRYPLPLSQWCLIFWQMSPFFFFSSPLLQKPDHSRLITLLAHMAGWDLFTQWHMITPPSQPFYSGLLCAPMQFVACTRAPPKAGSGSWNKPRIYSPSSMPWQELLLTEAASFPNLFTHRRDFFFFNSHKSPYKPAAFLFLCIPLPPGR